MDLQAASATNEELKELDIHKLHAPKSMQLKAPFTFFTLLQQGTCFNLLTKEMFPCQIYLQEAAYVVINHNSTGWDPIQSPNSPSNQHSCLLCLH